MKPISRLRMRARCAGSRSCTGRAVEAVAAAGRRVEQPQDREQRGLAAARGPGDRDVLALLDLEVDAGEGVGLDLVGVEDLAQALEPDQRRRRSCAHRFCLASVQADPVVASQAEVSERITSSPVLEPLEDLDRADRRPAQLHPHAHAPRSCPSRGGTGRPCSRGWPMRRAAHVEHVVEPLELDRPVDGQVGPRALRAARPRARRPRSRCRSATAGSTRITRAARSTPLRVSTDGLLAEHARPGLRLGDRGSRPSAGRAGPRAPGWCPASRAAPPRPAPTGARRRCPARTCSASTWLRRSRAWARRCSTSACCTASWASIASPAIASRCCSMPLAVLELLGGDSARACSVRPAIRPFFASSSSASARSRACRVLRLHARGRRLLVEELALAAAP